MDWVAVLKSVLSLVFVLGLIMLAAHLLRKYGDGKMMARTPKGASKRLGVVEVAMIDGRRRLVLVRRDEVEHLILLAADRETVIETGIHPVVDKNTWKVAE